jgi:hypothetical protein|tara:strand:+ start:94 stop:768 length:675 start_codon:yes stop_codon:yes gene_type:complete
MKKITLRNQKELESLRDDSMKVNSIDELLLRKVLEDSLHDNGIENFKEITNLNNISFGHFILIEKILSVENLSPDERVAMLSPIILRPLNELKIDNEDAVKEGEHKESVLDENIGNIYGAFNRFMEVRKIYLYKTYNGVIYETLDEDEDDEEEKEGTNVGSSTSARAFHTKKFFWNSMISDVAGNDIFKFSEVVELMMYVVMPFLAEKRSLQIVEYLEAKAASM